MLSSLPAYPTTELTFLPTTDYAVHNDTMATPAPGAIPRPAHLDRPEVEYGLAAPAYFHHRETPTSPTTSIDVLELNQHCGMQWKQGLDHDGVIHHFEVQSRVSGSTLKCLTKTFCSHAKIVQSTPLALHYV